MKKDRSNWYRCHSGAAGTLAGTAPRSMQVRLERMRILLVEGRQPQYLKKGVLRKGDPSTVLAALDCAPQTRDCSSAGGLSPQGTGKGRGQPREGQRTPLQSFSDRAGLTTSLQMIYLFRHVSRWVHVGMVGYLAAQSHAVLSHWLQ